MTTVYSFRKRENTQEIHIFLADTTPNGCVSRQNSICRKAPKASTDVVANGACLSESAARLKAAEIGRKVCGTCVSHLYETY